MEKEKKYCYQYPRPAVTTDSIVFGYKNEEIKVLLIQRKNEPYKGYWAFPGGFLNMDEDANTGALRELKEETGLDNIVLEQLYTFSAVNRDPRHRTISIAYIGIINLDNHVIHAGDDAVCAQWFSLNEIPPLAFDHDEILQTALQRLRHAYKKYSGNGVYFKL